MIEDLNDEEIVRTCYEKEFESTKQTKNNKEKSWQTLFASENNVIFLLIVGLIRKTSDIKIINIFLNRVNVIVLM